MHRRHHSSFSRIACAIALCSITSSASAQLVCDTLSMQNQPARVDGTDVAAWYGWGTGCYYPFTGRTNQRDSRIPSSWFKDGNRNNSRLCGPTSYHNALKPLFEMMYVNQGAKSSFSGWQLWMWDYSWVPAFPDELLNVARKVKNYASNWNGVFPGCGWSDCQANYMKLKSSYSGGKSEGRHPDTQLVDTAYLAGGINKGRSDVLEYNFKTETCSISTSGTYVCTYKGGGSHIVAVSGYYDYAGVRYIRVTDPGGGFGTDGSSLASHLFYTVKQITKIPASMQPRGANTRYLMQEYSGTPGVSTVWVIDSAAGVDQ